MQNYQPSCANEGSYERERASERERERQIDKGGAGGGEKDRREYNDKHRDRIPSPLAFASRSGFTGSSRKRSTGGVTLAEKRFGTLGFRGVVW